MSDESIVTTSEPLTERLATEWDELAESSGAAPFHFSGWIRIWNDSFSREPLWILTARSEGRLVAVAALRRRRGLVSSTSNWHTPEYTWLAETPTALQALWAEAVASAVRRLELRFVDEASALGQVATNASERNQRGLTSRTIARSPYVELHGGWDAYEQSLRKKFLSELRRRRRKLEAQGELMFSVEENAAATRFLDEGFAVEASGWKGDRKSAIASSEQTQRFYRDIAGWAADRGWLRLGFLRLGDRAIAFDFCLEAGGIHYLLKTGFDRDYHAFGPGQLIRQEMLKRSFQIGLASYEFLGDQAAWKAEWATEHRTLLALQRFGNNPIGWTDQLAQTHGRKLAKQAPALVKRGRRDS